MELVVALDTRSLQEGAAPSYEWGFQLVSSPGLARSFLGLAQILCCTVVGISYEVSTHCWIIDSKQVLSCCFRASGFQRHLRKVRMVHLFGWQGQILESLNLGRRLFWGSRWYLINSKTSTGADGELGWWCMEVWAKCPLAMLRFDTDPQKSPHVHWVVKRVTQWLVNRAEVTGTDGSCSKGALGWLAEGERQSWRMLEIHDSWPSLYHFHVEVFESSDAKMQKNPSPVARPPAFPVFLPRAQSGSQVEMGPGKVLPRPDV